MSQNSEIQQSASCLSVGATCFLLPRCLIESKESISTFYITSQERRIIHFFAEKKEDIELKIETKFNSGLKAAVLERFL